MSLGTQLLRQVQSCHHVGLRLLCTMYQRPQHAGGLDSGPYHLPSDAPEQNQVMDVQDAQIVV